MTGVQTCALPISADTLADIENYDERDWGYESHSAGLEIGSKVLTKLGKDE